MKKSNHILFLSLLFGFFLFTWFSLHFFFSKFFIPQPIVQAARVSCSSQPLSGVPISTVNGTYFFDEHNWTLYGWGKDILDGKICSSGSAVLHIDAHHDLGYSYSRKGVSFLNSFLDSWHDPSVSAATKLNLLRSHISNGTNIGNFLVSALALGWMDEVYWIRPRWDNPVSKDSQFTLVRYPHPLAPGVETRFELIEGAHPDQGKILVVHEITADQMLVKAKDASCVVFDTDLDYMSSEAQGAPEWVDKSDLDALKIKYDPSKVVDGKVRNPIAGPIHKSSVEELNQEIDELKSMLDNFKTSGKKVSVHVATSPGFLWADQRDDVSNKFLCGTPIVPKTKDFSISLAPNPAVWQDTSPPVGYCDPNNNDKVIRYNKKWRTNLTIQAPSSGDIMITKYVLKLFDSSGLRTTENHDNLKTYEGDRVKYNYWLYKKDSNISQSFFIAPRKYLPVRAELTLSGRDANGNPVTSTASVNLEQGNYYFTKPDCAGKGNSLFQILSIPLGISSCTPSTCE